MDPVDLAFDEFGRMFVLEMKDYPGFTADKYGAVRMLEDKDGDGD